MPASNSATPHHMAAKTQEQALCALVFLYTKVLKREVGTLAGLVRARVPQRLPVVLSQREIAAVITAMRGPPRRLLARRYNQEGLMPHVAALLRHTPARGAL